VLNQSGFSTEGQQLIQDWTVRYSLSARFHVFGDEVYHVEVEVDVEAPVQVVARVQNVELGLADEDDPEVGVNAVLTEFHFVGEHVGLNHVGFGFSHVKYFNQIIVHQHRHEVPNYADRVYHLHFYAYQNEFFIVYFLIWICNFTQQLLLVFKY